MSGRPAEVLQEFMGRVAQQDAAQAAKASWLVLQMRELEADRDAWQRRAKESERDRDSWQTHANNVRDHAEKAEAEVNRLQAEVSRLQRVDAAKGTADEWKERAEKAEAELGLAEAALFQANCERADAEVEAARLRAQIELLNTDAANDTADEWQERALERAAAAEKRAEKAETELNLAEAASFKADCARVVAESAVARLQRQLDLLRPTNPPPQPGTGDVWQEIIDSLSINHPMRAACVKRRELGLARYGYPLQYGNGRKEDLEEELLDAAAYAWQRSLNGLSGFLINAALDPATWWTLRAEHSADLNAKAALLERWKVLLAEAHAVLVDLLTHGDDAPAASYQRAAKVAETIAGGVR